MFMRIPSISTDNYVSNIARVTVLITVRILFLGMRLLCCNNWMKKELRIIGYFNLHCIIN